MPNGNNNNNADTVLATPNSKNNGNNNANEDPAANNNNPTAAANNNNAKSQSSAEGTRRVNPGTGKAKTKAQIQAAVMMKRAKKVLNNALSIKSTPPEFNPLIKIMKRENFANEAAKKAAINAYVETIRAKRAAAPATTKRVAKKEKAANATVSNKPKRVRKAKAANAPTAAAAPAATNTASVASGEKKAKRKVENPSAAQSQYKTNMAAAKKLLNNALGIKSMPPEHNPLVGIMRKEYATEAEKKAAINAHVEKIRAARAEKASKKAAKGGSRKTRKNRTRKNRA